MPCCKGKGLSWGQILLQPLANCAWLCREYPTTHSGLPFPGTPWNSPKLLPEETWESRSCCLTVLVGQAGHPWVGTAGWFSPEKRGQESPQVPDCR